MVSISDDLRKMREKLILLGWPADSIRLYSKGNGLSVTSAPISEQRLVYYHNVHRLSPLSTIGKGTSDLPKAA